MNRPAGPISLFRIALLVLLVLTVFPRQSSAESAQEIVSKVVHIEIEADLRDHSRWMYRDAYKSPTQDVVKLIIQTPQGNLSQIIEDNGHPPTPQDRQADQNRIQQMLTNPSLRQRQQRNENHDSQQATDLMNMLPKAFLWQIDSQENGEIRLSYKPNPNFSPPSMSARVLASMSGTMVVDADQTRLKSLTGRLMQPVEFAWGLLGHLDAGGTFQIIRNEIAPGIWQITQTHVHISGHVLFFKNIGDQEDEVTSDFRPVPDGVDLSEAARMLRDGEVARQVGVTTEARR